MVDAARSLRRHAATLAADVLALRRALDQPLAGDPRYDGALADVRRGITAIHQLAADLDCDQVTPAIAASPDHGDLMDGELVTK